MSQTTVGDANLRKISDGFIIRRFMLACIASRMPHNASSHQPLESVPLNVHLLGGAIYLRLWYRFWGDSG